MSNAQLLAIVIIGSLGAISLVRALMKRSSGSYRGRFNGTPLRHSHDANSRDDTAFPFASVLYLGDGGGSTSHQPHSSDCAHTVDAGGGCADGGGGGGH